MPRRVKFIIILSLVLSLFLAACSTPTTQTEQKTTAPTDATTPTPTPEPGRLIYVSTAAAESDPNVPVLTQFAADNGLQFDQTATFESASLGSTAKIVVLSSEPADFAATLDANPAVQFILLVPTSLSGKANLSVIAGKPEDEYFMAGYLATLIAYDWRSAGLVVNDSPLGAGAADAFVNGGEYVCGKCNPSYPPMIDQPQVASLPANASAGDWLTQANALLMNGVNAFYLDPAGVTPDLVASMVNSKTVIVSTVAPFAGAEDWWAATITTDASVALGEVLTKAFNGEGGQQITLPVTLTHVNANIVSPARQDLFNQTAQLLAEGKLAALSIP